MQRYGLFSEPPKVFRKKFKKIQKISDCIDLYQGKERHKPFIYLRAREESNTVIIDVVDNAVVGLIMMSLLP